MPELYDGLVSLRKVLHAQREHLKEKLAGGNKEEHLPGRCQGLAFAIERINEQIKSMNEDKDDDEG